MNPFDPLRPLLHVHKDSDYENLLPHVNKDNFEQVTLSLFARQAKQNAVYCQYLSCLDVHVEDVQRLEDIPFLPISFYKTHHIVSGTWDAEKVFLSSATTGQVAGKHPIKNLAFYRTLTKSIFRSFYGLLTNYHFIVLVPFYTNHESSSLITMLDYFVHESKSTYASFYLTDRTLLYKTLEDLRHDSRQPIVWGLSFALMDLAETQPLDLSHCIIMETGGMKGKRKEITRDELHRFLCSRFNVSHIHSEYGMTELMSQAYSCGQGSFRTPPWMKVLIRDNHDPFDISSSNKSGSINIIDLANVHTCAFIETQDLGKLDDEGRFEVLGRVDHTDIRGCNSMIY